MAKKLLLLSISLTFCLLLGEFVLRIYNPLPLPNKNTYYLSKGYNYSIINTKQLKDIDTIITVHKNSFGFRGSTDTASKHPKILFVGGSTTECFYISDGQDWPTLVQKKLTTKYPNIWANNAGMSGHSTYGHLILMDFITKNIRPDYICFLVGVNDKLLHKMSSSDKKLSFKHAASIEDWLIKNSRLAMSIKYLLGVKKAMKIKITDRNIDFASIEYGTKYNIYNFAEKVYTEDMVAHGDTNYSKRISQLIDICINNDIHPVFISQTICAGFVDPSTHKDLNRIIKLEKGIFAHSEYGKYLRKDVEYYNQLTRDVAKSYQVPFIELDSLLPKDSKYYYDFVHYTKTGNIKVAEIIADELSKILPINQ